MGLRLPTTPESRPPSSDAAPAGPARKPKGVLAPALRLVLALLGALAGYQTADRISASSFAPNLDQTGKIVWLVAFTLAGFAIGYAAGVILSRLLRRGLDLVDAEVTSVPQSPSGKMTFTRVLA